MEYSISEIKNMYQAALTASQTLDEGINNYLYGTHAAVLNIKNLIPTITLTLGISAIPVLAAAWARKNKTDIKKAIEDLGYPVVKSKVKSA